jgi:hypothetical protein
MLPNILDRGFTLAVGSRLLAAAWDNEKASGATEMEY